MNYTVSSQNILLFVAVINFLFSCLCGCRRDHEDSKYRPRHGEDDRSHERLAELSGCFEIKGNKYKLRKVVSSIGELVCIVHPSVYQYHYGLDIS